MVMYGQTECKGSPILKNMMKILLIISKQLKTRTENILNEQSYYYNLMNDRSTKNTLLITTTIKNTLVTALILETKFIHKISYIWELLLGAKLLSSMTITLSLPLCMYACVSQSQVIIRSFINGINSFLQEYLI